MAKRTRESDSDEEVGRKRQQQVKDEAESLGEQSDVEENAYDGPSYTLPTYFPLLRGPKNELRKLTPWKRSKARDKLKDKYMEYVRDAVSAYVANKLETGTKQVAGDEITMDQFKRQRSKLYSEDPALKRLKESMNELKATEIESMRFASSFGAMKNDIMARDEPEITIDNMQLYQGHEGTNHTQPVDLLAEKVAESKDVAPEGVDTVDHDYTTFKNELFVIINPTQPVPEGDEGEDEDDLEVEGGTVDLKCPISRELIQDPVQSSRCHHTYDRSAVMQYLRNIAQCPVCPTPLRLSDLKPDKIMRLRLDCHARDEELLSAYKVHEKVAEDRL